MSSMNIIQLRQEQLIYTLISENVRNYLRLDHHACSVDNKLLQYHFLCSQDHVITDFTNATKMSQARGIGLEGARGPPSVQQD